MSEGDVTIKNKTKKKKKKKSNVPGKPMEMNSLRAFKKEFSPMNSNYFNSEIAICVLSH